MNARLDSAPKISIIKNMASTRKKRLTTKELRNRSELEVKTARKHAVKIAEADPAIESVWVDGDLSEALIYLVASGSVRMETVVEISGRPYRNVSFAIVIPSKMTERWVPPGIRIYDALRY